MAPTNPVYGPNKFKIGLFNINCNGGLTMSKAPERWPALWDEIVAVTKMADEAGMDFILPVAKWHGYAGESNNLGRSFETMTHGAALGAITRQIGIFATVHVPITTPAFAAKAIATIDHVRDRKSVV
jgi:alkanesulfonate monooxygenase SsuD/methylene tetrahydromethanopterin reductase-like flavin-dependent oxidoreductase (luciferase family)